MEAPRFADVADELSWRLSGTTLVGHNLSFDARFLRAEFSRVSVAPPVTYWNAGLCTMRMSHEYLPGSGRSLQDCCDAFGITLHHAHSAGDDAEATAVLLSRYMELDADHPQWDDLLSTARSSAWIPAHATVPPVRTALRSAPGQRRQNPFLERIVARVPEFSGPAEHEEYLAVLDKALLDRYLSAHEINGLVGTAHDLGIGREAIRTLHRGYVETLATTAWADGVITETERSDLFTVAELLAVDPVVVESALAAPPQEADGAPPSGAASEITPGSMIVLTGDMSQPRNEIESEILRAGFTPHRAVTKKVALVVAADPDSLSGKARKARDYGIPVVGEDYLWKTLLV